VFLAASNIPGTTGISTDFFCFFILKLFVRFVLPTCGYYLALTGSAVWGFCLPYFPFAKEDIKNCGTGRYSRHAASTHPFSTDKRCQLDEVLVAMPGRKSLSAPIPLLPKKPNEVI